jgi:sensor histidine kinase YesM
MLLLFASNYAVIHSLIPPDTKTLDRANVGSPVTAYQLQHPSRSSQPPAPPAFVKLPPPPPFSVDDWKHLQGAMAAVFLAMLGISVAYFFIREWIRNDLRRSQAEAQQLDTEIRFLRSQVNPHFLFNTLNNLFSLSQRRGDGKLADGISKLSGMMRYMIYESNTDRVVLQREIAYLEDCIALNKLRYADGEVSITFRYPGPAVTAMVQVAPMLFVPFLENAFKHGVSIDEHSCIIMAMIVEAKKLIFTCENTDHGGVKRPAEEKGGIGLENVRRRLELVYPGRYELRAGSEEGKYKINLQIELT